MNLKEALREARRIGLKVIPRRGTGEITVRDQYGRSLQFNGRRKDAPRKLVSLLHRLRSSP